MAVLGLDPRINPAIHVFAAHVTPTGSDCARRTRSFGAVVDSEEAMIDRARPW
jgi:hypothetical protein